MRGVTPSVRYKDPRFSFQHSSHPWPEGRRRLPSNYSRFGSLATRARMDRGALALNRHANRCAHDRGVERRL